MVNQWWSVDGQLVVEQDQWLLEQQAAHMGMCSARFVVTDTTILPTKEQP